MRALSYHGDLNSQERQANLDKFRAGSSCSVCLASTYDPIVDHRDSAECSVKLKRDVFSCLLPQARSSTWCAPTSPRAVWISRRPAT
jgi:hypothetical protein